MWTTQTLLLALLGSLLAALLLSLVYRSRRAKPTSEVDVKDGTPRKTQRSRVPVMLLPVLLVVLLILVGSQANVFGFFERARTKASGPVELTAEQKAAGIRQELRALDRRRQENPSAFKNSDALKQNYADHIGALLAMYDAPEETRYRNFQTVLSLSVFEGCDFVFKNDLVAAEYKEVLPTVRDVSIPLRFFFDTSGLVDNLIANSCGVALTPNALLYKNSSKAEERIPFRQITGLKLEYVEGLLSSWAVFVDASGFEYKIDLPKLSTDAILPFVRALVFWMSAYSGDSISVSIPERERQILINKSFWAKHEEKIKDIIDVIPILTRRPGK